MLQDCKKKVRKEPTPMLKFIDDVFIAWTGSNAELPNSRFMGIRRLCTYIKNCDKHAAKFIEHFSRRRYSEAKFDCENVRQNNVQK